jgi:hypothetical protein
MAAVAARARVTRRAVGAWNPDVLIIKLCEVELSRSRRGPLGAGQADQAFRSSHTAAITTVAARPTAPTVVTTRPSGRLPKAIKNPPDWASAEIKRAAAIIHSLWPDAPAR